MEIISGDITNNWDLISEISIGAKSISITAPNPLIMKLADTDINSFYFIIEGELLFSINNNHYTVKPGQLALIPKKARNFFKLFPLKNLTFCKIEFTSTINGIDIFEKFGLTSDNLVVPIPNYDEFLCLCKKWANEKSETKLFNLTDKASGIVKMIAAYFNERTKIDSNDERVTFYNAIAHIENHLNDDISISTLSNLVSMDSNYFIRKFKKAFLRTPMKYLRDSRFERAAILLTETQMTVKEIGEAVGINDATNFSHFFKKYCGTYPTSYRSLYKETATRKSVSSMETLLCEPPANISIVPGNVRFQKPHVFWVEDFIFSDDNLYFVVDGELAICVEGKHYIARKNQAALLPAGKQAVYGLTSLQNLSLYQIDFEILIDGVNLFKYFQLDRHNYVVDIIEHENFLKSCINAMYEQSAISNISYHVSRIASMLKLGSIYVGERAKNELSKPTSEFEPAIECMKNNLDGSVSISQLAEISHMELTYFIRKFKKNYKLPPMKYYNSLRAEKAAELLLTTNMPVRKIGKLIGLNDQSYFIRFFKKIYKESPTQYRQLFSILHTKGS